MTERICDQVWKHFRWGDYDAALNRYQENCKTICRQTDSCPIKRNKRSISECMAARLTFLSMVSPGSDIDKDLDKFNEWRWAEFPPEPITEPG